MLPNIEESLNQFINTEDEEVRIKCVFDMLDYQSIENTLEDIREFTFALEVSTAKAHDLRVKLMFHKQLMERK